MRAWPGRRARGEEDEKIAETLTRYEPQQSNSMHPRAKQCSWQHILAEFPDAQLRCLYKQVQISASQVLQSELDILSPNTFQILLNVNIVPPMIHNIVIILARDIQQCSNFARSHAIMQKHGCVTRTLLLGLNIGLAWTKNSAAPEKRLYLAAAPWGGSCHVILSRGSSRKSEIIVLGERLSIDSWCLLNYRIIPVSSP